MTLLSFMGKKLTSVFTPVTYCTVSSVLLVVMTLVILLKSLHASCFGATWFSGPLLSSKVGVNKCCYRNSSSLQCDILLVRRTETAKFKMPQ